MTHRDGDNRKTNARVHTLEPIAGSGKGETPTVSRIHRVVESTENPAPRLLFLPPVWTRASFWLPLGVAPHRGEARVTDPHDDFAA
jgi:hypothetical protein